MAKKKNIEKIFAVIDSVNDGLVDVSDVTVHFRYDTIQQLSAGGITIDIAIKNSASTIIKILNPLDFLSINIQDQEGWPMPLPIRNANRHLPNVAGKFESQWPFEILSFTSTANEEGLNELIDDAGIPLQPNTTYTYSILIDQVQVLDRANPSASTTELESFKKGKYKLSLRILLLLSGQSDIQTTCETEPFEIQLK